MLSKEKRSLDNRLVLLPVLSFDGDLKCKCVYRIYFDRRFYIGSTYNLRERLKRHFYKIKHGTASAEILRAFDSCKMIHIEILARSEHMNDLRSVERHEIISHTGNPLLINKSNCTKAIMGFSRSKIKVAQFDINGNQLKVFDSITAAAAEMGYDRTSLKRNMNSDWLINGYLFAEVKDDGTPVRIPVYHPHRKGRRKKHRDETPETQAGTGFE